MPTYSPAKSRRKLASQATSWDKAFAVIAFLAVLAGGLFVWWYVQRPRVEQFPSTIETEHADFMSSIPSGVVHFRMLNITEIVTKPSGQQLIENATLVSLLIPLVNITSGDVNWVVEIEVQENEAVNVLSMAAETAAELAGLLNRTDLSTEKMVDFSVYRVRTTNNSWASLALIGDLLVYFDRATGTSAMERVLGAISGSEPRLFDDDSMERAYYLATLEPHLLGISLTKFTSSSTTGVEVDWMFSFAGYKADAVDKIDVFGLISQQAAIDTFDAVKQLYFARTQSQYIIGSFIVAGYTYPLDDLRTVILSL
jgi:hypothetical protein